MNKETYNKQSIIMGTLTENLNRATSLLIIQIGRDDGKEKIESLEKTPGKKSLQG